MAKFLKVALVRLPEKPRWSLYGDTNLLYKGPQQPRGQTNHPDSGFESGSDKNGNENVQISIKTEIPEYLENIKEVEDGPTEHETNIESLNIWDTEEYTCINNETGIEEKIETQNSLYSINAEKEEKIICKLSRVGQGFCTSGNLLSNTIVPNLTNQVVEECSNSQSDLLSTQDSYAAVPENTVVEEISNSVDSEVSKAVVPDVTKEMVSAISNTEDSGITMVNNEHKANENIVKQKTCQINSLPGEIYCHKNNTINHSADKDKTELVIEGTKCDNISENGAKYETKELSKGQKSVTSRRRKKRRPTFSHLSNHVVNKKCLDNNPDCSDLSGPYKSYRLAYVPGRQNVIKVIRRRIQNDSKVYVAPKEKHVNNIKHTLPIFTEQTLNTDEQINNTHSDDGSRKANISNAVTTEVNAGKVGVALSIHETEEQNHTNSDSSDSLLIDFPLPADRPDKTMKDKEISNNGMTINDDASDDSDRPLIIDESVIQRDAIIHEKPRKRIKNGRKKSRRSLEENENPHTFKKILHMKRKGDNFDAEETMKLKRSKKQKLERRLSSKRAYNINLVEPRITKTKPEFTCPSQTQGETVSDMDYNHNLTISTYEYPFTKPGMKNKDDIVAQKKRKRRRRIRSVSVGSGLRLPVIEPRVRHRRFKNRAMSDNGLTKTGSVGKASDRMNSFDFISPIVEKVWADMSKQKIEKNCLNDDLSAIEANKSVDFTEDSDGTDSLKANVNKHEIINEVNRNDIAIVQNDVVPCDDDRYNGTLTPGALGTRPLLRTPPASVPPLSKNPMTSECHVTPVLSSSPEPSSPPPLVPGKLSNKRREIQKPEPIHCQIAQSSEHSHYTVVAKSDTVLKVSRSPTYPKVMPPLIHDKPHTESPIVIEDNENIAENSEPVNVQSGSAEPIVIEELCSPSDSNVVNSNTKITDSFDKGNELPSDRNIYNKHSSVVLNPTSQIDKSDSVSPSLSDITVESVDDRTPLPEATNQDNTLKHDDEMNSKSPNIVYLHLNSSDLTNAKTKLLVEELDMLISRRELELQSLYSRRAQAIKKLEIQPHKTKAIAKLKTVEVSDGSIIEKPKAVKSKGGSGMLVPPPAHSNLEVRRRRHPKLQSSGVAHKMSNIRVVKWPRPDKKSENIILEDSTMTSEQEIFIQEEFSGEKIPLDKQVGKSNANNETFYTGQTVQIAGKTVPVLKPSSSSNQCVSMPTPIKLNQHAPQLRPVPSSNQTVSMPISADKMQVEPSRTVIKRTNPMQGISTHKERQPVPSLGTAMPHLTTSLNRGRTTNIPEIQVINHPPANMGLVNGMNDTSSQVVPSNDKHSAALKEYFVQTHLKEAVKNISDAFEQTFIQNNIHQTGLPSSQPELYALVARTKQNSIDQQNFQTPIAGSHSVTIEKVLNKLDGNKMMASIDHGVQNDNASPLAALSSLSQKSIPTSFTNVIAPPQYTTALIRQESPSQPVYINSSGENVIAIRPGVSLPPFLSPQGVPVTHVRLPIGPPQRFPGPQAVTVHHRAPMPPQFIRTVPPGILQRRALPPYLQQQPLRGPVPQVGPVPATVPKASLIPTTSTIPQSAINPIPSSGQSKVATSNMDPAQLLKHINEQVNRMQQQLVQSQMNTQGGMREATTQNAKSRESSVHSSPIQMAQNVGNEMHAASACSNCNNQALFLCAACQKVWYCSKDCQVKAWPTHQNHCICRR